MADFLDRWDELDSLLEQALELPAEERDGFLNRTCSDDDMRRHLERLLATAGEIRGELDRGAEALAGDLVDTEAAVSLVGRQIGAYRLVQELGSGGMGTVYLGERADGAFRQQVAIKIVRLGMATSEVLLRFRHERQVLASLEHPNIARLFDGGVSEEGLPYLVMEYVEGVPITTFCDRERLDTRARLLLFRTVCRAVQQAHRNLIVHRDLKPSNILVTKEGMVKLLDFGIAKLLDDSPEVGMPITRTGMHLMTPEYASPEQVAGRSVTTATDVYALGVLLYELLTGMRPYRVAARLQHEIARIILEQEPTRPSAVLTGNAASADASAVTMARATTVDGLRRQLRGDLDNIILKALAKEPERRYGTPEQLEDDVRRYLEGHPVRARPATPGYRASRFIRRNRHAMTALVATLLLITSLVGFYTAQLTTERDRATREAETATRTTDFLRNLFEAADPDTRATQTARDLLDAGTLRIYSELADEPAVQSELMIMMGRLYESIGDLNRADELVTAGVEVRRFAPGPRHALFAEALFNQAVIRRRLGNLAEADSLHRHALELRRRLLRDDDPAISESLNELGLTAWQQGRHSDAEALHRETLERRRAADGDASLSVSTSLNNLALVLVHTSRSAEAIPLFEEALRIRRAIFGENHSRVSILINNLALARVNLGEREEAIRLYRQALAINRDIFGEVHPRVASGLVNLGVALQNLGAHEEASGLLQESYAMRLELFGPVHPETLVSQGRLAELLRARGDYAAAESIFLDVIDHTRNRLGDDHPEVARLLESLGAVVMAQGRLDEAEDRLNRALDMNRAKFGDEHPRVASNLFFLGNLREAQGRLDDARLFYLESVAADRSARPDSEGLAGRLMTVGQHLNQAGQHADARLLFTEALEIRYGLFGHNDERTVVARHALEQIDRPRHVGMDP